MRQEIVFSLKYVLLAFGYSGPPYTHEHSGASFLYEMTQIAEGAAVLQMSSGTPVA